MRDEGYVEKANGFGGKVQRTFSGARYERHLARAGLLWHRMHVRQVVGCGADEAAGAGLMGVSVNAYMSAQQVMCQGPDTSVTLVQGCCR
jgi:hypothetical protein